jgi:hypothetical protein
VDVAGELTVFHTGDLLIVAPDHGRDFARAWRMLLPGRNVAAGQGEQKAAPVVAAVVVAKRFASGSGMLLSGKPC